MGKVQGTFASVVRGVSQQHPADRLEGQQGEQINMISDPVRGIVRRNGFVYKDGVYSAASGSIADAQADSYSFRAYTFTCLGVDYDLLYRSRACVGGVIGANHLEGLHLFNKSATANNGFKLLATDPTDTKMDAYLLGGFSAVTALGRYVLLAGNSETPVQSVNDVWGAAGNQSSSVFWVRGGGYSRTYTLKARRASDQVVFNVSYTTFAAAYPGDINTNIPDKLPDVSSAVNTNVTTVHTFGTIGTVHNITVNVGISGSGFFGSDNLSDYGLAIGSRCRFLKLVGSDPDSTIWVDVLLRSQQSEFDFTLEEIGSSGAWATDGGTNKAILYAHIPNDNYSAQLNDATAAYNQAVNQWTADAAADIVPSNIAQKLIDALTAAGFTGWVRTGSHGFSDNCDLVQAGDSSDGDFIVGIANQTVAADEVTPIHRVGKILKVAPKGNEEGAYYLKAFAKNEDNADTYQDVIWREAAGVVQTPTDVFAVATVVNETLYAASTPAKLRAYVLAEEAVTLDIPDFLPSAAGDLDSNPPPEFTNTPISALFVFQDRLGICAGSTVILSRSGDYFNFYRTTVLTLPDDDTISGFALGSEGDLIRKGVLYDRNLLLFGDKAIYNISGRSVQTPQTFNIAVQLNVENTSFAQPVGAGQNVSFLKEDTQLAASRMLQVKAGLFQDSPVVDDASKQLRDYINGTPAEMVSLVSPDMVFVRTEYFLRTYGAFPRARPWGLYVYSYLDQPDGQRVVDSWSAWEWSSALGTPVGITPSISGDGIQLYTLAFGTNELGNGTKALIACSCSARPDPTGLPYLDALRPGDDAEVSGLWTPAANASVQAVVATSYGAGYSYSATPSGDDAARFEGLEHPHYTVGDAPPEGTDANRWLGIAGWYSDAVAAFGAPKADNLFTGLQFPAFVDLTNPFVRDGDRKAITHGRLTLTRLRVTTTRTSGWTASFIDYEGQTITGAEGGTYARITYDKDVWVGRDVKHVQVRLAAKDWYPLTIAAIDWQGQYFSNSRRV